MKFSIAIIAVLLFASFAFPQLKSEQEATNIVTQPAKSIRGDKITFTSHVYSPKHRAKSLISCRGASLLTRGTAGYLAVHLIGDSTGLWYMLDLPADGSLRGAEFDAVGDSTLGTTVKIDTNLWIYPHLYK